MDAECLYCQTVSESCGKRLDYWSSPLSTIEYFYSAHSAYAYLGHQRLLEICKARGCKLVHRPFDLYPVIDAARGPQSRSFSAHYVDYFFGREITRWAQYRGLEVLNHRPTHHDHSLKLPNGFLIAAAEDDIDVDALSFALLQGHWRDDIDLADPDHLRRATVHLAVDRERLLERAESAEVQAVHDQNTQVAIARGVFGSPTYFLDGDMYYGQDHLELLDQAFDHPYGAHSFYNPPRPST